MNKFKLGTNFDFALLGEIKSMNEEFKGKSQVTEIYGSTRGHSELAARPDFRLPFIGSLKLEKYVYEAKNIGVDFNYTLNSFFPYGSKEKFTEMQPYIIKTIKFLENIGVERVTVANPIMLELIRNVMESDIKIEISTSMHIDTVTQIKYLHENYGIDKVCGNLLKNRDFNFLEAAAEYCNKNGIMYELMVNEFCGVGGTGYATHCVYRDSCYMCHATGKTLDDANAFNEYPMKLCTGSRNTDQANWLKMRFIRPEDLVCYRNIGIENFKITGRTASTGYITGVLRNYMSEDFNGNLLNLWKPLESIKDQQLEAFVPYEINNKDLDGFMDIWTKYNRNCDNQVCGETCHYCDDFLRKIKG